jgi:hypothetical protein
MARMEQISGGRTKSFTQFWETLRRPAEGHRGNLWVGQKDQLELGWVWSPGDPPCPGGQFGCSCVGKEDGDSPLISATYNLQPKWLHYSLAKVSHISAMAFEIRPVPEGEDPEMVELAPCDDRCALFRADRHHPRGGNAGTRPRTPWQPSRDGQG